MPELGKTSASHVDRTFYDHDIDPSYENKLAKQTGCKPLRLSEKIDKTFDVLRNITEVILIDSETDSILQGAYGEFFEKNHSFFDQKNFISPQEFEEQVLKKVSDYVNQKMIGGRDQLTALLKKHSDTNFLQRRAVFPLGFYIQHKVGVCRQKTLLSCFIIEKLIEQNILTGKIQVDRNLIKELDGVIGGHQWGRYTTPDAKIIIVDPAQNYVGDIEHTERYKWDYEPAFEKRISLQNLNAQGMYVRFPGSARAVFIKNEETGSYFIADVDEKSTTISVIDNDSSTPLNDTFTLREGMSLSIQSPIGTVEYIVKISPSGLVLERLNTMGKGMKKVKSALKKLLSPFAQSLSTEKSS